MSPCGRTIAQVIVYGEAERPRVVAQGFDRTHPFAAVIDKYAGTVRYLVEDPDIRWDSWDAVVALGDPGVNAEHLRVLQIGGDPGGYQINSGFTSAALYRTEHVG